MRRQLNDFMAGTDEGLIDALRAALPSRERLSPFQQRWHEADLETLGAFYRSGPRRNFELRRVHHLGGSWIGQEELDDLLAFETPRTKAKV